MEPLVSVILPVCNAADYLPHCLDSLLKQKHENIEIIAIDDNSKDASLSILKQYRKLDKRISYSANVKRYGLAITLNRALKKAQGDFITFMNPYDINSVWRIKKQLDFLRDNPKFVAVGTQVAKMSANHKIEEKLHLPHDPEQVYKQFMRGVGVHFETLMINKRSIPRDLLYFKSNQYPFVYIEAFVKLFQYGKITNLLEHFYYHRGKTTHKHKLSKTNQVFKRFSLAIKSFAEYDYRPSLSSFFSPRIKPNLN